MRKRDTSRNKTSLNRACFTHNLSITRVSNWGWNGPHGAHFSTGEPQKFAKQTEYDSKTTVY